MKLKYIYLTLCIIGTIVPYASFVPWLAVNGVNIPLLVREIMSSPVTMFGWLDVVVSAIVLFVFIFSERQNIKVKYMWLSIVGTLTVGVSLGLPLYLFLREISQHD